MKPAPRIRARNRSRGVAAIELALSMTFLVPLLLAVMDFGYYFYIGAVAEDAAQAGVRAAVRQSGGATCVVSQAAVKLTGEAPAPTGISGPTCLTVLGAGGAASCVMNEPPLRMGELAGPTTVTLTCAAVPVDPTWSIAVQVTFAPAVGFFTAWMPSGGAGKVRYTARLTSN